MKAAGRRLGGNSTPPFHTPAMPASAQRCGRLDYSVNKRDTRLKPTGGKSLREHGSRVLLLFPLPVKFIMERLPAKTFCLGRHPERVGAAMGGRAPARRLGRYSLTRRCRVLGAKRTSCARPEHYRFWTQTGHSRGSALRSRPPTPAQAPLNLGMEVI
jgi:hypothetical protein